MMPEPETRQLLIDSCHSSNMADSRILAELESPEFVSLLVRIAVDADDYGGDAPMQAAYYLSRVRSALLQPDEASLIDLLGTADGYAGFVALALGHMRSQKAKPIITRMMAEGCWPRETYQEALSGYDDL
jgi:hypothetical protein